jgi:hypothetical protein
MTRGQFSIRRVLDAPRPYPTSFFLLGFSSPLAPKSFVVVVVVVVSVCLQQIVVIFFLVFFCADLLLLRDFLGDCYIHGDAE